MQFSDVADLASGFEGVRCTGGDGSAEQCRYRGRLVARELDKTHIVIRTGFAARDELLAQFPDTFTVPPRFRSHMMVVADLASGDERAISDAIAAAWVLQRDA